MFEKIVTERSLSKYIAEQIERAIMEKEFSIGEKLPSESELCEAFGVSRTPVREAIKILAAHDLVEIKTGIGVFVKTITSDNISDGLKKFYEQRLDTDYRIDLIQARQVLEPGIAYHAALKRDEGDLEKIFYDIEMIEKSANPAEHAKYDVRFHLDLAHATKNNLLVLMLKPLHKMMPDVKHKIIEKIPDAHEIGNIWHRKIFDAVKAQDAKLAREMMTHHLKIAEEHILAVMDD